MNFVVAVLLLVVDEETAFYCLCTVVEKILPGHFHPDMAMTLVDQVALHAWLLSVCAPQPACGGLAGPCQPAAAAQGGVCMVCAWYAHGVRMACA